eukprot:m.75308 g.75308  ORF g.75308 m.75308 type:complete len:734 (+) comp17156_c0_seq1:181-2382(+)
MSAQLIALYDTCGDASTNTPALRKGERLLLIFRHENGWLEIQTEAGVRGYVAPAWVQEDENPPAAAAAPTELPQPPSQPPSPEKPASKPPSPERPEPNPIKEADVITPDSSPANSPRESPMPADDAVAPAPAPAPAPAATSAAASAAIPASTAAAAEVARSPARPGPAVVPKRRPVSNDFTSQLAAKLSGMGGGPPVAGGGATAAAGSRLSMPPTPTTPTSPSAAMASSMGSSYGDSADEDSATPSSSGGPPVPTRSAESRKQSLGTMGRPHRKAPPPPQGVKPARAPIPPRTSSLEPKPKPPPASDKPALTLTSDEDGTQGGVLVFQRDLTDPAAEDTSTDDLDVLEARNRIAQLGQEGPLERKYLLEGGKEPKKKNWAALYAVLAGTNLYFFKDEKDKKHTKKGPSSILPVEGMEVNFATELTKKKNAFVLSNDQTKILFQAPDEETMLRWVQNLQTAAPGGSGDASKKATLRPGTLTPDPSPRSSTLEEESPTPTKKELGFVRKKLAKLMGSRPAKEDLKQKGILQDTMFGGTMRDTVAREKRSFAAHIQAENVPIIVSKCIPRVEKNLTEQGIYRISGNSAHIQRLVAKANEDISKLDLSDADDVHAVSGLLKLYFRELSDPVFTEAMYPDFINAAKIQDKDERLGTLKNLVCRLPPENYATLNLLFDHLLRVSEKGDVNKMQINNIAIVFGPTLLRQSEPSLEAIVMDAPYQNSVVEELLREKSLMFS